MKKGILSFTVVLAFAIVNVLGCFSAAAVDCVGNTHVTPYSYSDTIKTVIVDDDFEDRTVDVTMGNDTTSYAKPLVGNANCIFKKDANGNMYAQTTAGWVKFQTKPTNGTKYGIDSDRIAISLDLANPVVLADASSTASTSLGVTVRMNDKPLIRLSCVESAADKRGIEAKYFYQGGSEAQFKTSAGTDISPAVKVRNSGDLWNHAYMVFKRNAGTASGTYTVSLEKLVVNGYEYYTGAKSYAQTPNFVTADWWSDETSSAKFIAIGNTSSNFAIDNVAVYVPGDCSQTRVSTASNAVAKTVYVDDDFNDRTVGGTVASNGVNRISASDSYGVYADSGNSNKFIKNKEAWKTAKILENKAINSNKMGLSFKYKLLTGSGSYFQLKFGSSEPILLFKNDKGIADKDYINFYTASNANTRLCDTGLDGNVWTQVDIVFEEIDSIVYMKQLYINGTSVNLSSGNLNISGKPLYCTANWRTDNSLISLTQISAAGISFDDILLYEPATITTGFEIANFNNGTVTIRNANADALNLTGRKLIVAAYDKGDNLLGAAVKEIGADLASGESTLVSFADVTAPTGTAYYKFFAWNDLNDMVPLFTQAEVTAK